MHSALSTLSPQYTQHSVHSAHISENAPRDKCFRKSAEKTPRVGGSRGTSRPAPSVPERADSLNKKTEVREAGNLNKKTEVREAGSGKKAEEFVIPTSQIIPIKLRSRDQVINK